MVAYSPTCAFEPGGRLAVMFNDEREFPGNPQIWCQRFRPDRTRIGLNRKVNRPNAFPANSHWSVGQSIGATAEALVFAWTDNRRHRGWDIFAKLTDWELVGAAEAGRALFRGALLPGLVRRGAVHRLGPDESASVYDATGRRWCRQTGPGELRFPLRAGAYFVVTGKGPGAVRKVVVE
jgi:hypothetical protein